MAERVVEVRNDVRWREAEMIRSIPCMKLNEAHRLAKSGLRPSPLPRPKLHRIVLLRPAATGGAGESGMAEVMLVALFSLLVRAKAAATSASCASSTAPRGCSFKRACTAST